MHKGVSDNVRSVNWRRAARLACRTRAGSGAGRPGPVDSTLSVQNIGQGRRRDPAPARLRRVGARWRQRVTHKRRVDRVLVPADGRRGRAWPPRSGPWRASGPLGAAADAAGAVVAVDVVADGGDRGAGAPGGGEQGEGLPRGSCGPVGGPRCGASPEGLGGARGGAGRCGGRAVGPGRRSTGRRLAGRSSRAARCSRWPRPRRSPSRWTMRWPY